MKRLYIRFNDLFDAILQELKLFLDYVTRVFASVGVSRPIMPRFAIVAYRKIRPLKPAYRESYRTNGLSLMAGFTC